MLSPLQLVTGLVSTGGWRGALAGLLAGAFAALGQAPVGAWPATAIGFALLFGLLRASPGWQRGGLLGWIAGTGYFAVALSWIVEPFLVDAARDGWMAPFALVFMATGLALFWAAAFALARVAGGTAVAFIAALTLAEALRGRVLTGFPWAQPGHVWIDTPLLPLAGYAGALGLSVVTLALAALLWHQVQADARRACAIAVLLAALAFVPFTPVRQQPAARDAPVIRLVQPNAAQHQKWDPAMIPIFFQRQMEFTRAEPRPDLIVWPETAIPVLLNNAAPTLAEMSRAANGTPIVVGAQRVEGLRLFNTLAALGPEGRITALYDKHHLVPFGEYIPFGSVFERFGLRGLAAENGSGFSSGPGPRVIGIDGIGAALPLICYEGIFPQDVAGAPARADFMLLITNDAWFGKFSGPYQHFAQARLRSVEQGLPLIRVANTGISAMIDAKGAIVAALPLGQAGYLDVALPAPLPPTLYARSGDAPLILLCLVVLGGAMATARRRMRLSD